MKRAHTERELRILSPIIGRKAAEETLRRHNLADVLRLDKRGLMRLPLIGPRRAEAIQALPSLVEILAALSPEGHSVSCSRDVYDLFRQRLSSSHREQFLVLTLNTRNIILSEEVCAVGRVNSVHVQPAEVLRPAVLRSAASIICLHNHPSGDPTPSAEDMALTDRINRAAQLMGIRLLDHIIIAAGSFYSFSDAGGI